jgi:uncharacterized membrane protein
MNTGRLESFSDGVLAVAITLLVLALLVPHPQSGHTLAGDLGHEWAQFVAYAISFVTVGIIWINHHAALNRLREADHTLLVINLLLLMSVVLLPFTTNLMASYLRAGRGEHLAAAVYGGSLLLMGLAFLALNVHIMWRRPELLASEMPREARTRFVRLQLVGIAPYALATALAAVSPYLTLALTGVVAAFYALPGAV